MYSALSDSLALDISGGVLSDGANIQIFTSNGSEA
ncbi:RICIN domain-containing protein [Collinsella sp. OM06-18AC]